MNLLLRRRMLMEQAQAVPSPVMDGLVAWFDMRDDIINPTGTSQDRYLQDRINNGVIKIEMNQTPIVKENGTLRFTMPYQNSRAVLYLSTLSLSNIHTTEFNGSLYFPKSYTNWMKQIGNIVVFSGFGVAYGSPVKIQFGNYEMTAIYGQAEHLVAVTENTRFYRNNSLVGNSSEDAAAATLSNCDIAAGISGVMEGLTILNSIKFYNRPLTEAEIAQNYAYEKSIDRAYPTL